MFRRTRSSIRLCVGLLLTLFIAYYAMVAAFAHVHIVNGVMIVHSHPFSSPHEHSAGQAMVLHFMTTFQSLEAEISTSIHPDYILLAVIEPETDVPFAQSDVLEGLYLRAPPAMF